MISRSENITDFCVITVQNQETEKGLKTQTRSEQNLLSSGTTRNKKEKEKCKEKKYFNPYKEDFSLVELPILL